VSSPEDRRAGVPLTLEVSHLLRAVLTCCDLLSCDVCWVGAGMLLGTVMG